MEIFLKLHPHSISYLYSIQTDKQTESLNGWLSEEAHAYLEPSLSGKCMGLVVRVADIKKLKKKAHFSPCIIELFIPPTSFTDG